MAGSRPPSDASSRPTGARSPTTGRAVEVVVVGASAGGVGALRGLVGALPADLGACLLVVLHMPTTARSALAEVLGRHSRLRVARAEDGTAVRPGALIAARPDHHLLVDGREVRLTRTARVNGHRPAIDPLFESAAAAFGARALGVLLSGTLDDGVAGSAAIRDAGGLVVVQDPAEAEFPGMPQAAIDAGVAHRALPLDGIADLISRSASRPVP